MIYGLHAKEPPRSLIDKMETFMYKPISTMMKPRWGDGAWSPGNKQLYQNIQQSAMESWLNKTEVMTMLTQTREMKTIRPKHCKEMTIQRQKIQAQWRRRNNAIKKNTQQPGTKDRIRKTEYIKTQRKRKLRN